MDRDGHDVLMNARQRVNHSVAAPEGNADPNEAELLIFDVDRENSLPVAVRPVRRAIDGETFEDAQIWLGAGRTQRAFSVAAKPMTDDDGDFDGTVVSFTDITELQLALTAKDDFLSSVSHEFRTPLTSIIGYLEIALQPSEQLSTDMERYLQVARRNALRLERLVEDLLAISAGKFRIKPIEFDLGALLAQSVASVSPRAQAVRVAVTNRAPTELTVYADPVRIGQTVDNLLDNAVKYNRPGGTVKVDAAVQDGQLTLSVTDTGIGIEDDEVAQVFDRFFRSPAVRISTVTGVGLGLLITRSIVQEHGGTISVASALGIGSTFTVCIPMSRGGHSTPPTPASP